MLTLLLLVACSSPEPQTNSDVKTPPASTEAPAKVEAPKVDNSKPTDVSKLTPVKTPSGMTYWEVKVGDGPQAKAGQVVSVHYTGWLKDSGLKFDSSRDRNEKFEFSLGAGEVIPGWDEGVATMKVGGTSVFEIPANLAYGEKGAGGVIPPGATLLFDVELLGVK